MALTREEAEKLAQLRGKTTTSPIKNTSSPVDAWTKGMESVPKIDTQQKIDPIALQNEWAQLPYDARDEMLLRAMKNGNTYILQSYPEDERGWQKFSGLKLDDRFIQTVPKFQNTTISQGQNIDRASVEAQLKTEADPLRQAELRTQLEQAPPERNLYDQILMAEDAINTNERLAQMKANERANGVDYLVRMKANAPTEGVTNVFNEFGKGFSRASQQVLGGVFGAVEMFSEGDPYLVWLNDYAQNQADAVRSSILKTPELNRASSTKNFLEGGASDPNYYANVMGSILPHIAGAMTASVLGGVAGGAPGAVAGASAYSFTMESGSLYNDLLAEGYDMEEARLASMKYGAIAGALDSVIPAKIGGSIANTFTNQLLKHGMKQSAKKTLAQTIKEFGKDVLIEASTEASQELAQNITKKYFNENQDIWENVIDSFVGGALGGGVFGAIGAGNNAVQGKTETLPEGMRNYSAENGYQGADAQALASEKVTPKVKKSLQSYEQTVGIAEQAKQGFARLEEVEYGLQASIRLAELMKVKDPTDMTVSQIQEQAGQELEKVNVQKQLLEKQYEQGTKVDVVALPEFTMSVGETIDGKFVASADLVLETGSDILANPTKYDTRAEAELGMTELVQEYIGDKLRSDSIESFDIETLSKVNQELLSFVSQPNPQRMIRENRDVMLLAQDMKDYGKFEKAVRKNNLLPEGTDLAKFYERAQSKEGMYVTAREARGVVEKYAKDMGVSTEFVDRITTPEGKRALGSFMRDERVIKLVTRGEEGMPDVEITTPYHEVGHAYFQTMMTPSERAEVLQEIKNNSTKELTDREAEEILVEDLRAYNDKKTLKALKKRIQPAYARLLDSIKEIVDKVLKWIGRSSEDKINQFYEDVLSMKRPSEKVKLEKAEELELFRTADESYLKEKALEYDTYEAFEEAMFSMVPEYAMSHRPSWEDAPSASNLLETDMLPKDVYDNPRGSISPGYFSDPTEKSAMDTLKRIRNNPYTYVKIYRAAPVNELNIGDWVSLSKEYADMESQTEGTPVWEYAVPAKDVLFAGDYIHEFGYFPKTILEEAYNKAHEVQNKENFDTMVENNTSFRESPSSLEEEALKYDTVEEFIDSQGVTVYHGTNNSFDNFELLYPRDALGNFKGAYFVDNIQEAKDYGKNIKEVIVNFRNPLVGNPYEEFAKSKGLDFEKNRFNIKKADVESWIKENGFDGIIRPAGSNYNLDGAEYIALNNDVIKTKQQLTDIYNKAHGESFRESPDLYHGTTREIVGDLQFPLYTTTNKEYASVFARSTGASSIAKQGIQTEINSTILDLKLSPTAKILDIKNPEYRKLLEDEYFGKYSVSDKLYVGENGNIDWTEGQSLAEWIEETGKDFNVVILDEGNGVDEYGNIVNKGESYMILNEDALIKESFRENDTEDTAWTVPENEESYFANVKYNDFKEMLSSVADDPVAIYELIAEIYPEAVVDFEKGIIDYSQTDIPTQYIEEATFDAGVSLEDLRYIIINSKKPELKNIDQESFWDDLPSYVPKPSKSIDDALYEVGVEMQIAEKGYRYGIEGWDHFNKTVAMHSTFPDWVRDPYRSSILLQQAAQYMDGKFRIPATYKTGLRSVVWDAYEEASRRSGGAIDIDALRKRFEETDEKLVRTPRRIDYKKFATPITAEDKATIEQLYNEAPGYSDVYSEDTAYASLEFLQKAYDTERELLSRTGSPFPEELAQLLRDVHAYSLAGLEDLIRTITEANIRFMDKNYELFLEVPNTMFLRAKSYEELLSMVREYDSELAGRLLALENGKDLYATYTRFMNKYYDTKKAVKMQRSLEKVESQDMKQIENAVAKLKDMRIKFIQKQEAEAYKKTERQRVKNVARMINLVDRKRIKDLETEITMSDKQYLKDMYKAQAKGANASALETARIIKQKLRETRKYKEMIGKVEALRQRVRASVKTGGRYYVEYARKLLAVFDEYDTSSLSNRSMEKLQDIYEMMYNNENISDEMKDWYKKNIERVSKKSLREMTYDEVVELYTMLSSLANKGAYELAQVQYFSEQEKERRIALAIESTRNMDGEGRKGTTRAEMSQGAFKEALVRTGLDVLSPVAVMDKFDGGKNFTGWNAMQVRSLQKGEQKWYAQLHGATEELKARVQEIKPTFTAKEETFLSLVARSREEADGAVKNLLAQLGVDIIPAQVEGLTLEQAEQIIDIIEDISEKYQITTQLKTIFESRTNKPFPVKKHYVAPLKYTNRITDTTDADIEALQNFSEYGTEVGEGMSIARMEKVDLEVRTDLLTLVTEGWNHSLYYINMQPRVDNIQSVVGSKEFKEHAGRIVSKYWKEYLAGVANKGKSMGDGTFDPILRSLRQNFQVAILGFKATTVLLQPTAGFNAVMTANALYGSDTALAIMAELAQAYIVPSYKADALTQSEALTLRAGSAGSTDFAEINRLMETGLADLRGNYSKLKAGAIKAGMYMIQEVDIRTASAVRQGMYKALIARGVPEAKASADADFFMSLSQSSTQLVDRPLILARYGEFGRLFFTFQTFTLGLWSMITQGLVVNGLIKGTPKVKIKSALALLAIPFFTAFAGEMISIVNNAIKGKDDEEELEDKLKNALENTWVELVATVPLFGSIIKGKVLYNRNYEVPLVGTGLELIDGIQGLMDPKDYDDFIKNLTTVGKTGSIFAGIPGAFQATDIINRFIITEKERKTIETNLVARQYIDSGERNIDQYVAQLASKLYSTEELVKLDKAKLTSLKKSILKSVVKMGDNEEAKNIMKLSTNDEKANYLKEIRSLYVAQEYKDLLEYLKKYGILSKEAELLIYKK